MALPPEPIDLLVRVAPLIVDAEVARVLEDRSDAPRIDAPPDRVDVGRKSDSQLLLLRVNEAIRGELPGEEFEAVKPVAPYRLAAGFRGPFMLAEQDGKQTIIGRYGPNFYSVEDVKAAIRRS
jgi:hypothetical protein